jgi:hypothetical protein
MKTNLQTIPKLLSYAMPFLVFGSSAFAASATSDEALASAKESMKLAESASEEACAASGLSEIETYVGTAQSHAREARAYSDEAATLYTAERLASGEIKMAPEESTGLEIIELDLGIEYDTSKKATEETESKGLPGALTESDPSVFTSELPSGLPSSSKP